MRINALMVACLVACGGNTSSNPTPKPANGSGAQRLQILYDLDLDKALDDKLAGFRADLIANFEDAKVRVTVVTGVDGTLRITPVDPADAVRIQERMTSDYKDTLIAKACPPDAERTTICVGLAPSYVPAIRKAALDNAVRTIRARVDEMKVTGPEVSAKGEQIVVTLPGASNDAMKQARALIPQGGTLEFKIADEGSALMRILAARVDSDTRASEAGIKTGVDQWNDLNNGTPHFEYYLMAQDREQALSPEQAAMFGCPKPATPRPDGKVMCKLTGRRVMERYLEVLAQREPDYRVPDDRIISYERMDTGWRTYLLVRASTLTGKQVASATMAFDPNTSRPMVLLDFTRDGARLLAKLTAENVGRKLATVLDGEVKSAPILTGTITGGRASIDMGGSDPAVQEKAAADLALVLRTGSLPTPLRESSVTLVP